MADTRRLALISLFMHNIGDVDSYNNISPSDALIEPKDFRETQHQIHGQKKPGSTILNITWQKYKSPLI